MELLLLLNVDCNQQLQIQKKRARSVPVVTVIKTESGMFCWGAMLVSDVHYQ